MSIVINLTEGNQVTIQKEQAPIVTLQNTVTNEVTVTQGDDISVSLQNVTANQVNIIQQDNIGVTLANQTPIAVTVSNGLSGDGSNASLIIGSDRTEGLTDVLKPVTDNLGTTSKLSLSKNKTEIQDVSVVRSSVNPVMRLIADSTSEPTAGDDMGTLRFTRNFEDPLDIDLARAIYNDFVVRVNADGGAVEGSIQCVTAEILPIVAGEYLINTAEIRPEYSGILNSTNADMVFYVNDGGFPIERFRVQSGGDVVVKDPSAGVILHSQDNTPFRIVVSNTGAIEAIPPTSAAPIITSLPVISGLVSVPETITATAGDVTSLPTFVNTFQWQVSDTGINGWVNIAGATTTSLALTSVYGDKYVRIVQTTTNILGSATANSLSTVAVQPWPQITALKLRLDTFENEAFVDASLTALNNITI